MVKSYPDIYLDFYLSLSIGTQWQFLLKLIKKTKFYRTALKRQIIYILPIKLVTFLKLSVALSRTDTDTSKNAYMFTPPHQK